MAMRRIFAVLGLVLATTVAARATEIPILDSLIRVALTENPSIEAAEQRLLAQESRESYAGWLPDPHLSVGWLNLPRSSLALDETPMSGVQFGLTQMIPWPGKLSGRSEVAALKAESHRWDVAVAADRITSLTESSYYDYAWSVLADATYGRNLRLIDQIIEVTQTRYANGKASAHDVLRAQTAKARLENRRLQLDRSRLAALARLAWLTNDSTIARADMSAVLPEIEASLIASGVGLTGFSNPNLAKASVGAALAEKELSLARSEYWPDLSVGLDYRIRKDHPMDAVGGEDFLTFRVGVSLPVWFFKRQNHQTEAARSMLGAARAEEESLRDQITQQVTDTRLAIEATTAQVRKFDSSILPQARAALEAAQIAYEVGQVDFNGYLASVMDVLDIELERLQLLRQYHQYSARMRELASGNYNKVKI